MDSGLSHSLHFVLLFLLLAQISHSAPIPKTKNHADHISTYIVHADPLAKPSLFTTHEHWYNSLVATHSPRAASNSNRLLYTYDTVLHGFAVQLTGDEARRLSNAAGVTGVHEDRALQLLTTRSPEFLGLDTGFGAWKDTHFGDGVIIGVVDTSIWPESASFNDTGLGPVRPSWKGMCVDAKAFDAGAKAMGRSKSSGVPSPRDMDGHGTCCSSIAAGSEVQNVEIGVFARGTAKGVAPKARIAMYGVPAEDMPLSDVVAAMDAAVKDGVDILSIPLGYPDAVPFHDYPLAIVAFGAERKGVLMVLAGGNFGPTASSLVNVAPWMTNVGAGTLDRLFPASIKLGDGAVVTGQSLYAMESSGIDMVPLVSVFCNQDNLTRDQIMGKIVVCVSGAASETDIQNLGGVGLILMQRYIWYPDGLEASSFSVPGIVLSRTASDRLLSYMASMTYPVGAFSFTCETVIGENRAPTVVYFSSRGPNPVVPELLKPDVLAPGQNIVAAWQGSYDMATGTSASCPHVAGVAALIKKKHGEWTPARIRSALMTTAASLDNTQRDILDNAVTDSSSGATAATPFAAGAGHVRPQLAMDPGLVYDAGARDYLDFLCSLNYTTEQLRLFAPDMATCTMTTLPGDLNYPSFVVVFHGRTGDVHTLTRTVTKVSEEAETYNVTVVAPRHVKVTVKPATMEFKEQYEKKSYSVEFRSDAGGSEWEFGHIIWENEKHQVRSPVAFMWKN